jgi:hypothetical protein
MGWLSDMEDRDIASRKAARHDANIALVTEGVRRWQLQDDELDPNGPSLGEYLVALLEQEGRLR